MAPVPTTRALSARRSNDIGCRMEGAGVRKRKRWGFCICACTTLKRGQICSRLQFTPTPPKKKQKEKGGYKEK
jgi:hypothetical protein